MTDEVLLRCDLCGLDIAPGYTAYSFVLTREEDGRWLADAEEHYHTGPCYAAVCATDPPQPEDDP